MANGQVLGELLYQIIQLMTSTATNAKNFKFHWVSSFSQVQLAHRVLVVGMVIVLTCSVQI